MGIAVSSRGGYLLDTNHLGAVTVLCELEADIQQVRNPVRSRQQWDRMLYQLMVLPIDRTTALIYGELFRSSRFMPIFCLTTDT